MLNEKTSKPIFLTWRLVSVAAVLFAFWLPAAAQQVTLTFATAPGSQVPSSWVSGGNFQPGSVLNVQFAPLGVSFNNTGYLNDVTGVSDGMSTSPDSWCATGGYNCSGNNVVVANSIGPDSRTGLQSVDTLTINFVQPQTAVQMDIDNGYLGESLQTNLQLKAQGMVVATLTLTPGNEIAACPQSQSQYQLCGRFNIADPMGQPFDEIDILPTTIVGAPAQCTITSGYAGGLPSGVTPPANYDPNCGGSLIDNLTFSSPSGPLASMTVRNSGGQATSSFCPGDTAVLDGSASADSFGAALTYSWADKLDSPPLFSGTLTGVSPSFTVPNSPGGYTVQLTATDTFKASASTSASVSVKSQNQAPVAQAASPGTVDSGAAVTLDGTGTFDPDGDPISYQWTQTAGPTVVLTNANTAKPSFIAPTVSYPGTAALSFQLTATDSPSSTRCGGPQSSNITVTATVEDMNHPPVANAGQPQTVISLSKVTLNGSASSDPDGDLITYQWIQTAGTPVTIQNPTAPMPTFTAPQEPPSQQETLTFQLVVTDQPPAGHTPLQSTAKVNVTVQDPYAAPDCSKAVASQTTLWPPDHRMVGPLSIINTKNNDSGSVTITTTSIFQDEPTSGLGSGDTAPDAKINSDGTFFLRAERSGTGDGRVYHVSFTAANHYGGSCSGVVTVCAPHDTLGSDKISACVDEGAHYDSTH